MKRTLIWIGALVVGAVLGLLGINWLNEVMNVVATIYTRLFQLLAVPTIVLSVFTTHHRSLQPSIHSRTLERSVSLHPPAG